MPDRFQFYSKSSDSPPGKGTGETLDSPSETYTSLSNLVNWRRLLSNAGETPFEWKGEEWATADQAYESVKTGKKTALLDIWKHKFEGNTMARNVLVATREAELWSGKTRWIEGEEIRKGLLLDMPKRNVQGKADMSSKKRSKKAEPVQAGEPVQAAEVDITNNSRNLITTGAVMQLNTDTVTPDVTGDTPLRQELAFAAEVEKTRDSSIRFCTVCNNYLYLHVDETNGDLQRSCRNCGYKDTSEQGGLVSEMRIEQLSAEGYNLVNEFTLLDPRLPHLHGTMKCINSSCQSNKPGGESDIVYIKYDAENLRYMYICTTCKVNWKSRR
jgi:DNA-directed RNA polymerase subunit M/transcription elongation factor TFIIS